MIRLLTVFLCFQSVIHSDLSSNNVFSSMLFPAVAFFYFVYLLVAPTIYLTKKGLYKRGDNVNVFTLFLLLTEFFLDTQDNYSGQFGFLGVLSRPAEFMAATAEVLLAIYAYYTFSLMILGAMM